MSVPDDGSKLSVLLVTYNHEDYVGQALESLFGQDYPGTIELVVADDASTDGTLALIRAYDGRDSRFVFRYLAADINRGITRNYQRGFSACRGEYVAVLEGDDYWVSPKKLTRQAGFLDEHRECDLCAVNYFVLHEASATFSERAPIGAGHRFISARDLIADNLVGNFSTCMYRISALVALPDELFRIRSYDWIVNICVARTSKIGFLEEPMSVYRLHSSGAWSKTPHLEKMKIQLELIPAYNALTNNVFSHEFKILSRRLGHTITTATIGNYVSKIIRSARIRSRIRKCSPPFLVISMALILSKLKTLFTKLFRRRCV